MATFNMTTHLIHRNKFDLQSRVHIGMYSKYKSLMLDFNSYSNEQNVTITLNRETALNLKILLELYINNYNKEGDCD